jgi:hypothetical protein
MKQFIYRVLTAWEDWAFDLDQPALISVFKFTFSIVGPLVLIVALCILADPDQHVILNTTKTWSCVDSHEEWENAPHGKTSRWEYVTECDRYERKSGHEHDWSQ